MTTMNEVNNNKTKVLDEFIFRTVSLVRFTANSMSKFSHNRCKCKLKLIMKTTAAHRHAQQQLYQCFSPLFCSP